MEILKYNGAGNDFFAVDIRGGVRLPAGNQWITNLCERKGKYGGSDGIIVLADPVSPEAGFSMGFFNPDGSSGMMCGNGGRCIVAFAADMGISPESDGVFRFDAPDGCVHQGFIIADNGKEKIVKISMRDVETSGVVRDDNGVFADTGTRHLVVFVDDTDKVDLISEGPRLRYLPEYGPVGVNVNFVQLLDRGELGIRTYEKGVEAETLACGTGNVAAALAVRCHVKGHKADSYLLHARGGDLKVDFVEMADGMLSVCLTGPTQKEAISVPFSDVL